MKTGKYNCLCASLKLSSHDPWILFDRIIDSVIRPTSTLLIFLNYLVKGKRKNLKSPQWTLSHTFLRRQLGFGYLSISTTSGDKSKKKKKMIVLTYIFTSGSTYNS